MLSLPLLASFSSLLAFSSLISGTNVEKATPSICCGSLNSTITPVKPVDFKVDTAIDLQRQWIPFFFGDTDTWAVASNSSSAFYLPTLDSSMTLRIVDAFDTGDRFAIYVNGTNVLNTTEPVVNEQYTTDPYESWEIPSFSRGQIILPSGIHRITIKVLKAHNPDGGRAYLRADLNTAKYCGLCRAPCHKGPCQCNSPTASNPPGCCANQAPYPQPDRNECKRGMFTVIKSPKNTRDGAIAACTAKGMKLAAIDSENFSFANNLAFTCNHNQPARSWVASWNTDSYNGACLVLDSGSFSGLGAITVGDCGLKLFALCQKGT